MPTEQNKMIEHHILAEMNKGNWAIIDEVFATDFIYHGAGGLELRGREAFKQFCVGFATAFPGFHLAIEEMFAEGDTVVIRTTTSGTHKGDFMGMAPTGKRMSIMGILIARFTGGREVEAWELMDSLGLRQQLGLIPPVRRPGE